LLILGTLTTLAIFVMAINLVFLSTWLPAAIMDFKVPNSALLIVIAGEE